MARPPVRKPAPAKRKAASARSYPRAAAEAGAAEQGGVWTSTTRRAAPMPPPRPGRPRKPAQTPDPGFQTQALGLFMAVADAWDLNVVQRLTLLGKPASAASTYHHWKRAVAEGKAIPENPDLLDRIAYVVGIFEAAGRFWGDPGHARRWLTEPNAAVVFQGQPPLARMLGGRMEDLRQTCAYLESATEGAW